MTSVWTPITIGKLPLEHRFALAPMTRGRAQSDGTPSLLAAEYYAQRASLGLLITEGTQPSDDGQGYIGSPGIYTDGHVNGWLKVTDAVHAGGGHVFIQLMHVGRQSHPDNTLHHCQPVAPSAVSPGGQMFTPSGMQDIPEPRALSTAEVEVTVQDFRLAARKAIDAGADGVEIHGANGYLVHQFLAENANLRTDAYGGSIENRSRFALEVAQAIADEIGPERTSIRLSPGAPLGGIVEGADSAALYRYLTRQLAKLNLAYLHIMHFGNDALLADVRALWPGPLLVVRLGRTRETLLDDLNAGVADMVPIGRWALANPDFVERYRTGAAFSPDDPATYYAGGATGYTDYPFLADETALLNSPHRG